MVFLLYHSQHVTYSNNCVISSGATIICLSFTFFFFPSFFSFLILSRTKTLFPHPHLTNVTFSLPVIYFSQQKSKCSVVLIEQQNQNTQQNRCKTKLKKMYRIVRMRQRKSKQEGKSKVYLLLSYGVEIISALTSHHIPELLWLYFCYIRWFLYLFIFFSQMMVPSSHCIVLTSHVIVLLSHSVVPFFFSHIWWYYPHIMQYQHHM